MPRPPSSPKAFWPKLPSELKPGTPCQMHHSTALRDDGADQLRADVHRHLRPREPAADRGADGDGRVEVTAGDAADRVGHHQHGEAERQAGGDHVGAGRQRRADAEEHQDERADHLGRERLGGRRIRRRRARAAAASAMPRPSSRWCAFESGDHRAPAAYPRVAARSARLLASERVQRDCSHLRSRTWDHLHPDRRGAAAGDVLVPADRAGVRRPGRCPGRDPRHLPGRPHHRRVRRPPARGPAHLRRAGRAGRAREAPRGQHHQAAQRQRLDPAAEGRRRRAARPGLRPAGLPRRAEDRRRARRPRPLRQGQGQRGQPGAPRGQLRPPRARVGQAVRPQPPALDGRVVGRLAHPRRHHGRRRLPPQRAVGGHRRRRHAAHRARRRRRHRDGAQGVGAGAGRRGRRRDPHGRRQAARVPGRADRPRQGRGRALLGAPQGHHDEGLRPDHLRPRRAGVLPGALPGVRRRAGRPPASRPTTASARCCRPPTSLPDGAADQAGGRADGLGRRPARWRWSTPTAASPTSTSRAT